MKIISLSDITEEGISHNPEIKKKVMIRRGEIPYITNFSQANFKPGQTSGQHIHENLYEVFLVEEGEGTICIENTEYYVRKGFCVVAEPGEMHNIINTTQSDFVITYFGLKAEKK
ncbi:MAG: cupin domain-containing protein [wastewater metagenome]|nr:cupin domain-containing protein [Candidatus Loosdrechtia aerotolerans]